MIEAKLDELIAALDRNTAAHSCAQSTIAVTDAPKSKRLAKAAEPTLAPSLNVSNTAVPSVIAGIPTTGNVTIQQVAAKVLEVVTVAGRQAAVDLLASYKAPRASDLKPEQYVQFVRDAETRIKDAAAPIVAPTSDLV